MRTSLCLMGDGCPEVSTLMVRGPDAYRRQACHAHASLVSLASWSGDLVGYTVVGKRGRKPRIANLKTPLAFTDIAREGQGEMNEMAQATTHQKNASQPTAPAPQATGPGRPAKGAAPKDPKAAALANLQYTLDRANNFIHDGTASVAVRMRRAARAGVPREVAEKALATMRDAVADCEAAMTHAYAEPTKPAVVKSRVSLA